MGLYSNIVHPKENMSYCYLSEVMSTAAAVLSVTAVLLGAINMLMVRRLGFRIP